jgi:hypothetical protein
MRPPTQTQLDNIEISHIPDANLKLLIYTTRENANSNPLEVILAQLAHGLLEARKDIAQLKKRK